MYKRLTREGRALRTAVMRLIAGTMVVLATFGGAVFAVKAAAPSVSAWWQKVRSTPPQMTAVAPTPQLPAKSEIPRQGLQNTPANVRTPFPAPVYSSSPPQYNRWFGPRQSEEPKHRASNDDDRERAKRQEETEQQRRDKEFAERREAQTKQEREQHDRARQRDVEQSKTAGKNNQPSKPAPQSPPSRSKAPSSPPSKSRGKR